MPVRLLDDVQAAAARLAQGGLVAFPTETVYGLGADASNPQALARIYAAKQRPNNHPLIVHVTGTPALGVWARRVPEVTQEAAHQLGAAFWPGPLTLVVPRAKHVLDAATGGQDSVALRCPAHPLAQALLAAFTALSATKNQGAAGLAAPSANLFGHVSPTAAAHVVSEFASSLEDVWVLDDAAVYNDADSGVHIGIESTIVDVSRVDKASGKVKPVLLRPGHISAAQLEAVLGCPVAIPDPLHHDPATPRVSGSLRAHYAPRTPLYVVDGATLQALLRQGVKGTDKKTAVWHFGLTDGVRDLLPAPDIDFYLAPAHAAPYARQLYAQLRAFDDAGCYARILVQKPPVTMEWAGVMDRLSRAAAAFDGLPV